MGPKSYVLLLGRMFRNLEILESHVCISGRLTEYITAGLAQVVRASLRLRDVAFR